MTTVIAAVNVTVNHVIIFITVTVIIKFNELLSILNMSLQDNCIILCKIDISRNFDKGKPITVTTAVAITVSVMVTVPVNPLALKYFEHEFEARLYHSPQD